MVLQCSADVRGGIVDGAGYLDRGPAAGSGHNDVFFEVIEEEDVGGFEARECFKYFANFYIRLGQSYEVTGVLVAEFGDGWEIGGSVRRSEVALPVGGVGVREQAGGGFVISVDVIDELRDAGEFGDEPGIVDGLKFLGGIEAIDGMGDFLEEVR